MCCSVPAASRGGKPWPTSSRRSGRAGEAGPERVKGASSWVGRVSDRLIVSQMPAAAQNPPTPSPPALSERLPPVLVVDDEPALRHLLRVIIERLGYPLVEAGDGQQALLRLEEEPRPRVVLCDVRMPRMSGLDFLRSVRERDVFVVMMSAYASTDLAIEALRDGAYDFITKPFRPEEIGACLKRIVERERLAEENRQLRQQVRQQQELAGFIGRSAPAREVMAVIERVAAYPSTVLLTGESGTGKELLAQALHERSDRRQGPMVAVNCAAIPEALLESELFGYERGPSPAPCGRTRASSSRPRAGPCCSTRSGRCRWACRPSCCACSRTASTAHRRHQGPARSTCGWWRRPPATSSRRSRQGRLRE
jgi:CheY-like chemotaxis protein